MALKPGERLLILGSSGSGKTTLLHILSGLLSPDSGHIFIQERELTSLSPSKVDDLRGSSIGMVFQRPHFIRSLNVRENILLANALGSNTGQFDVEQIMEDLNIAHLATKSISQLSEGEKQRIGIARALANHPIVIFADEPTSALDDENCNAVIKLLIESSEKLNAALVVVTHDARIKSFFPKQILLS